MRDNIFLRFGSSGYYICFISLDNDTEEKELSLSSSGGRKRSSFSLENSGFKLVGEQPEREFLFANGKKIPCKIRADYLVCRGRRDIYMWLK